MSTVTGETLAERIKQLLGQGIAPAIVASSVGCDPSYISQLWEDEEFRIEVLTLRATKAEGATKRDNKWDEIEEQALERAGQLVSYVTRPNDLIRIAAMANAAKRRATEFSNGSETAQQTVNLVLPESSVIHFQMNSQSQVVSVEGRSMIPLQAKNLTKQLQERRLAREEAGTLTIEAGTVGTARAPQLPHERKKCETILEQIGFLDEPVPVQKVMP